MLALQQLNTDDHTFLSSVEGGERGQGSGWVAAHRGVREEPELKSEEVGRVSQGPRAHTRDCRRARPSLLPFWLGKSLGISISRKAPRDSFSPVFYVCIAFY